MAKASPEIQGQRAKEGVNTNHQLLNGRSHVHKLPPPFIKRALGYLLVRLSLTQPRALPNAPLPSTSTASHLLFTPP